MGASCASASTREVPEPFKMHETNPVATPCDRSSGAAEDPVGSHVPYREAVGCLMYEITGAHPNIAFAVSRAAGAMNRPTETDRIDVKLILKYLRETSNFSLLYGADNSKGVSEAFRNVYIAGNVRTRL